MSEQRFKGLPWLLVGVLGTLWVTKGSSRPPEGQVVDETPQIVKSIKELGFLQAAEINLSEAFQFATHKSPDGPVAEIPGVRALVAGVTKNTVWVQVNGKVTAGIDLSRASVTVRGDSIRISLPEMQIQPAQVDLKLLNDRHGIFWRDDEILLKAIREARLRFQNSAQTLKIGQIARASTDATLRKLLKSVSSKQIVIE